MYVLGLIPFVTGQREEDREQFIAEFKLGRNQSHMAREADKDSRLMTLLNQRVTFLNFQAARSSLHVDIASKREVFGA